MQGAIIHILEQVCFVNKRAVVAAAADLYKIADRSDNRNEHEQYDGCVDNPDYEAEQLVKLTEHRQMSVSLTSCSAS